MCETAILERKNKKKMKTNDNPEPSKLEGLGNFTTSMISATGRRTK